MTTDKFGEKNWRIVELGTKSQSAVEQQYKLVKYPFDRYEVTVALTLDEKFIGVIEVKVNKDFRSYEQRITKKGYLDVGDIYEEDE